MKKHLQKLRRELTADRVILTLGIALLLFYFFVVHALILFTDYRINPIPRVLILLLICTVLYCGGRLHLQRTEKTVLLKGIFYLFFALGIHLILTVTLLDPTLGRSGDFFFNDVFFRDPREHYVKWFVNLVPMQSIYEVYIKGLIDGNVTLYYVLLNLLGNLCLFMPIAFLLPILFKHQRKWYFFIPTVTLSVAAIEALQFTFMVGSCDIDDLILNVLGAILVFFLCKISVFKKLCHAFTENCFS